MGDTLQKEEVNRVGEYQISKKAHSGYGQTASAQQAREVIHQNRDQEVYPGGQCG